MKGQKEKYLYIDTNTFPVKANLFLETGNQGLIVWRKVACLGDKIERFCERADATIYGFSQVGI